jgi:ABC-type multidrug transport system permease subunit
VLEVLDIVLIPSLFITAVIVSYILVAPEGFQLNKEISYVMGIVTYLVFLGLFMIPAKRLQLVKVKSKKA